jgi:lysophospholipase L1-like esterase
MTGFGNTLAGALTGCSLILCSLSFAARGEDGVTIELDKPVKSNIPDLEGCLSPNGFRFTSNEPCPDGEPYFYIRYELSATEAGMYRISIKGPGSGARGYSRYSLAIDDSPPVPVPLTWRVGEEKEGWHDQGPFALSSGRHALEFRFTPEQRMRDMNRVTEPYVGHKVRIEGLRFHRAVPKAKASMPPKDRGCLLRPGDRVVLFGDSITEEGFYARHLARLLETPEAGERIEIFNSGVSLNRTWEGLDRLEADVLALRPDWVILAFGVNDAVHMAPDEFRKATAQLVHRMQKENIKVVCATPSGMSPEPDGDNKYFHTPDRSQAFDRTMAMEAGIVLEVAEAAHAVAADIYGTFTRAGLPRRELMGSQWHPSDEGGRAYALTLLHALGFSKEGALRTGDSKDASTYAAISSMPRQAYPAYGPKSMASGGAPADGQWVVASSFTENSVVAFSRTTGQQVGCVPVGHHPMGIAYSGKRRELYVACEGGGRLDVIRLPEFERAGSIPLGEVYPVGIALADERTAWVGTFFGGSVIQVDLEQRKPIRTISIGALVEGIAVGNEGRVVLAAARDKGIVFIDSREGRILSTVRGTQYAASFFATREGTIHAIDTAAWTLSAVDVTARSIHSPRPSPFEARALITDPETDAIWAGDWKSGRIVRVAEGRVIPFAELPFPFGIAVFSVAERR